MGYRVDHTEGPVGATGTSKSLFYRHPADQRKGSTKIGCVTAEIKSGTMTGKVRIYAGWEGTDRCIGDSVLTKSNPRLIVHPDIILEPGQMISCYFTNITAGDTVYMAVEGH